jgi:predicted DsbA family dithiol-disulfide isomerase
VSEFLAFEYTDVNSFDAWCAESVLRDVRERYEPAAWWQVAHTTPEPAGACTRPPGARTNARPERVATNANWAARAAYAAQHQGRERGAAVLRRLREATFVHRRPVADADGLRAVLAGIPGLDIWRLLRDLDSPDVLWSVERDHAMARRHGFTAPTVFFRGPGGDRVVAGRQSLTAYVAAVEAVAPAFADSAHAKAA